MADGFAQAAQTMHHQKRYVAHTYMSSKCDVTSIDKQIEATGGAAGFESYVLKAASKAFSKVFPDHQKTNISRVVQS